MISSNGNNNNNASVSSTNGSMTSSSSAATSNSTNNNSPTLRNVMAEHHLQYQTIAVPGGCPYDQLIDMIRDLDLGDEAIIMANKIRKIEQSYCDIVRTEDMLTESIEYINNIALEDNETSTKFAMLFSSHTFERLAMQETKLRSAMLKVLETNYLNADHFRTYNRDRLWNSITLLGEYYNRVRLADNSPLTILGESLLNLLIAEVDGDELINTKLARVILTQVTMNGENLRQNHRMDLERLLFHLRRHLIEQNALTAAVKALLLMTIDLFYTKNVGPQLERMYTKYLLACDNEDLGNNNMSQNASIQQQQQTLVYQPAAIQQLADTAPAELNDTYEAEPVKKWSEQVCEDSLYESEFGKDFNGDCTPPNSNSRSSTETPFPPTHEANAVNDGGIMSPKQPLSPNNPFKNENHHRQRGGQQQKHAGFNNDRSPRHRQYAREDDHQETNEERDQTKPLPRWRNPRFNRDANGEQQQRHRNYQQDDDHQSVRSDGGSIRLYSVGDRLRHSQEKMERSSNSNSNYNHIANWDHHSQRDDRSERSYVSNYERGAHGRNNGRHYNNRQTYDKPPRFLKNQQQQQQQNFSQSPQNRENNKIHSDSWRRSNSNAAAGGGAGYHDGHASTLPRSNKNYDNYNQNQANNYRRSQSPYHGGGNGGSVDGTYRNRARYGANQRYGSQNSLCSDKSASYDRRGGSAQREHWNNRRGPRQTAQQQQQQQQLQKQDTLPPADWDADETVVVAAAVIIDDNNSELVRNARQTTNYMNYLSSQK